MSTKTRFPCDIGSIIGSIVAIVILAQSPNWTPPFIHKFARLFLDRDPIFFEIPTILILCLGGGRFLGYLVGLLVASISKRKKNETAV